MEHRCSKCGVVKPRSEFHGTKRRRAYCKPCCRQYQREYSARKNGTTWAERERAFVEQAGLCGCCGKAIKLTGRDSHTDHDHETGKFRGLLCNHCNTGLGKLGDNMDGLKRAVAYLERAS